MIKAKKATIIDLGLLILITVIAYFPVAACIYSLKNDSLVQYLPFRYHLSESIQHGYFPFWSPYLYTGFPIHADMQGMTWNPIVLVISVFTRYNMSVLEFEVTIYLLLASIGMYFLLKAFALNRWICVVGAASYACCGFINGSASVIPWISSAAFVPYVFLSLKRLLENISVKNSILFAIALSFLFLCGYPTFFIYTCFIIVAAISTSLFSREDAGAFRVTRRSVFIILLAGIVFLLICSPAILSYVDFLPYYSRGSGITAGKAAENPFTPFSSISYLLPNSIVKDHAWLNTDPSMRNGYVGLFVFALFVSSLFYKKSRIELFILITTIVSFLLSLGSSTPLHRISYKIIPLFNTFRHPANLRLYTSIGIILLAAIFFNRLILNKRSLVQKKVFQILKITAVILSLILIVLLFQKGSIQNIASSGKLFATPKTALDNLSFNGLAVLQVILQLTFLFFTSLLIRKHAKSYLMAASVVLNVILFCWIALPFTFISQIKTKDVNAYVSSFPDGYPLLGPAQSAEVNVISDSSKIPIYGYPNFYNKRVTVQDHVITPTLNSNYETFLGDSELRKLMANYPLAWLNDTIIKATPDSISHDQKFSIANYRGGSNEKLSSAGTIELISFRPGNFIFRVKAEKNTIMSIFQQYNHNWKAWWNQNEIPVYRMNFAFIGVPAYAGEGVIRLEYIPSFLRLPIWLSVITIIFCCTYLIITYRIKKEQF